MNSVDNCMLIELPSLTDDRGSLAFIEQNNHIPFEIKRVFYMFNLESGSTRGGHSLKKCNQLIVPLVGKFNVTVDDSWSKREFKLDGPNFGLFIPHGIWRNLSDFSDNAVCLVLASEAYSESDYFRSYNVYVANQKQFYL